MNKFVLAAVAATMATAAHAVPIPVGPSSSFSFGGNVTIPSAPVSVGDTLTIATVGTATGGSANFDLVTGNTPAGLVDIIIALGNGNLSESFTIGYADPDGGGAAVPGTFTVDLGETTIAQVEQQIPGNPLSNLDVLVGGAAQVTDSEGFFDPSPASWLLSATAGVDATTFSYTFTVSVPPSIETRIPVPAALPLLLTGIAGLGFLGWRRTRTDA